MGIRTLAFVDLDDTLFSSLRKHGDLESVLEPAALLANGDVISYSNPGQRALLRMLQAADQIIPVTARNIAAYRRVLIRFKGLAVVSHGATILLQDGTVDPVWHERVAPLLQREEDNLKRLLADIEQSAGTADLRCWLVYDAELPVYLVVKHKASDGQRVAEVARDVFLPWLGTRSDYTLHVNGNNMAVIPPGFGKAAAVAYLLERERAENGTPFTIGAGDSISDLDFMKLCDVQLTPSGSQLALAADEGLRFKQALGDGALLLGKAPFAELPSLALAPEGC